MSKFKKVILTVVWGLVILGLAIYSIFWFAVSLGHEKAPKWEEPTYSGSLYHNDY